MADRHNEEELDLLGFWMWHLSVSDHSHKQGFRPRVVSASLEWDEQPLGQ